MIPRYRLLSARIRKEVEALTQVAARAEGGSLRAERHPEDEHYFLSAAALDLQSFYTGVERLLAAIADTFDGVRPQGEHWHRDLLAQMTLSVPDLRPAVLNEETRNALVEFLEFRHVVRNVYSFDLRGERVIELVRMLHQAHELVQENLLAFADFLDTLSDSDSALD